MHHRGQRNRKDLLAIQRRQDFVLQTPELRARGAILVPRLGATAIDCGERAPYVRCRPSGSRSPRAARRAPALHRRSSVVTMMIVARRHARYQPAKGGDPMSHGSAMGSVQFVRETRF